MYVNAIYPTFQGEANPFGIGSPSIFLRLQGCHLRCYKKTLGVLCDTPEALEKTTQKQNILSIFERVKGVVDNTKIKVVTLTGGDPLWNNRKELVELFTLLTDYGVSVVVETSGTISWLPFRAISKNIYWVIDYKLKSAGIDNAGKLFQSEEHLSDLTDKDFLKFVVYDKDDLAETIQTIEAIKNATKASIVVGAYWGGKLTTFEIFNLIKNYGLLGRVAINMQTHKMAVSINTETEIPKHI